MVPLGGTSTKPEFKQCQTVQRRWQGGDTLHHTDRCVCCVYTCSSHTQVSTHILPEGVKRRRQTGTDRTGRTVWLWREALIFMVGHSHNVWLSVKINQHTLKGKLCFSLCEKQRRLACCLAFWKHKDSMRSHSSECLLDFLEIDWMTWFSWHVLTPPACFWAQALSWLGLSVVADEISHLWLNQIQEVLRFFFFFFNY